MELELGLDPDDAPRLTRLALLARLKSGRARSWAVRIVWHDSPDRALAQQGLALAEQRPLWRLERLHPGSTNWPPGTPAPVLATGRAAAELGQALPDPLVPLAAFDGRASSQSLAAEPGPVGMTLLNGAVRTFTGEHRISRVRLEGAADAVQVLAIALASELRLEVPRASLAGEAFAAASGMPPPPRREGAPELPPGLSVAAAFAYAVGHLCDVIFYFAPKAAEGTDGPEPVHQMRVAVRRLRSAIKVFRHAVRCPAVEAADAGLKALAAKLAPTRDWDVFVTETTAGLAAAFPTEQRLDRLLSAAERRRRICHDELRSFLASVEFRRIGIELACLAGDRDWQAMVGDGEQAGLAASLDEFAARVLRKRRKKLMAVDDGLTELEPVALHAVRLNAKRLRYAAEIFAPLYPGKATHRFIRGLSQLQDRLGTLNDAAVAAGLVANLTGNHAFATGLVLGFIGAHSSGTRERINKAWLKFHGLKPFWESH
jgi:CHAD domain-containing protein